MPEALAAGLLPVRGAWLCGDGSAILAPVPPGCVEAAALCGLSLAFKELFDEADFCCSCRRRVGSCLVASRYGSNRIFAVWRNQRDLGFCHDA